uniref:Uncharacterized protein n=1 Tax=Coccidioides posadasii RMSCC 3488 TaxID=454284 RepID=A0A0J6FE90_COCPO|nr:hypothetical protein CPAG_03569 [Coccidioides posadasii RMSCC 3488]
MASRALLCLQITQQPKLSSGLPTLVLGRDEEIETGRRAFYPEGRSLPVSSLWGSARYTDMLHYRITTASRSDWRQSKPAGIDIRAKWEIEYMPGLSPARMGDLFRHCNSTRNICSLLHSVIASLAMSASPGRQEK